jgi:transcriptional regulator with XRE-family HTH domain
MHTNTQEMDLKIIIGKRVKFFRIRKVLTQMELATKIGYTSSGSISDVEKGKKALAMEKLQIAADVLEVPVSLLVTPIDYDSTEKKAVLLADLVMLFRKSGDIPAIDIIQAIVSSELQKIK